MVLGLRAKNRKGTSVNVDYLVQVQDIKPWPPSQSLKSLRSALLQWENGDRSSGSTKSVVPSLGSGVDDGKIEFNESFRLPVTLSREGSVKGGDSDTFQKNCLEFNLYEPRRDKTVKGQLLGTVIIDLAEYGVLKETVTVSAPMNCKRSFRNTAQPILNVKIQPIDKRSSSSTPRVSLSKEPSLDKDGRGSISALMNGEYAEESEIASFTDDDISSHSSQTMSSSAIEANGDSPPQNEENALEEVKDNIRSVKDVLAPQLPLDTVPAKPELKPVIAAEKLLNGSSSRSSSIDLSTGVGSPENGHRSLSNFSERSITSITRQSVSHSGRSSSSLAYEVTEEESTCHSSRHSIDRKDLVQEVSENNTNGRSGRKENVRQTVAVAVDTEPKMVEQACLMTSADSRPIAEYDEKAWGQNRVESKEVGSNNTLHAELALEKGDNQGENGEKDHAGKNKDHSTEAESKNKFSPNVSRSPGSSVSTPIRGGGSLGLTNNSLRKVKSVRSPMDPARSNGSTGNDQFMEELKETDSLEDADTGGRSFIQSERKETTSVSRETRTRFSDNKVQKLEQRIEKLERELREAAALEVALYSIVAEHGSSANKVHAPARRLSRLYLHTWKQLPQERRATAARSSISGLVLVAKACGNDVPRLTFWLSNCVVLRAIISSALGNSQLPVSAGPHIESNGHKTGNGKRSPLKWTDSSPSKMENKFHFSENVYDWEEPHTFTTALEKIEAWIFSRIIESVWWQTLTPHMQSSSKASEQKINTSLRNSYGRSASLGDQEQANFSLELWKKAFKDACERICPVRAAGHECGCLPMLARLVMEQCVSRLDVAMFNAILRESADEIPTDPVSDPISDSRVLPISAGKSSFGAGAQLKNAIGNWSRWLTDLFGIDDEDANDIVEVEKQECETSSKSFHLLNALSDLMMLPKDMLLNRSIRKEVCPTFSAPLIKTILDTFSPDEFCPDPIPEEVFEALDAEDLLEAEESIRTFPCNAAAVVYLPPSAALLSDIIGEVGKEAHLRRSGSSILRKSYTSDDELDELDSPLTSITDSFRFTSAPNWKQKGNRYPSVVRYQLLQEVWRGGD